MNSIDTILYVLLAVVTIASLVIGIWQFFLYVKLSWTRKENSRSFNGIETAEAIFTKMNDDISVKTSFWNITYVRYSTRTKTLKLGPINSKRRTVWTAATSGRQAYSAHILEQAHQGNKPPISTIWFRLQTFWFSIFISLLYNVGIVACFSMWAKDVDHNIKALSSIWLWIGIAIISIIPMLFAVAGFKTSKLMMNDIQNIFGNILTKKEIENIGKLWKLEYINSIIEMIKTTLLILISILRIIATAKE